jgi:hypothetical protein
MSWLLSRDGTVREMPNEAIWRRIISEKISAKVAASHAPKSSSTVADADLASAHNLLKVAAGWYSRREKGQPVRKGVQPDRYGGLFSSPSTQPEHAPFPQGLEVK